MRPGEKCEHRLTLANVHCWFLKRAGKWKYQHGTYTTAACQLIRDFKHTLMQGHVDTRRRGKSNRGGRGNRRWIRFVAENPPPPRGTYLNWPSDFISMEDFE